MAPYLLILVMQHLSDLLLEEMEQGHLRLHRKCKIPIITNLKFAYVVIIFYKAEAQFVLSVMKVLDQFAEVTGLGINVEKSLIFFLSL